MLEVWKNKFLYPCFNSIKSETCQFNWVVTLRISEQAVSQWVIGGGGGIMKPYRAGGPARAVPLFRGGRRGYTTFPIYLQMSGIFNTMQNVQKQLIISVN